MTDSTRRGSFLFVRARGLTCALPLARVIETMRPLAVVPVLGAASYVLGASIVRGSVVPVVDLGALLGMDEPAEPTRFVCVRAGNERKACLRVESVLGARSLEAAVSCALPPLLDVLDARVASALVALDREVCMIIDASRVVPEQTWAALESGEAV